MRSLMSGLCFQDKANIFKQMKSIEIPEMGLREITHDRHLPAVIQLFHQVGGTMTFPTMFCGLWGTLMATDALWTFAEQ